MDNLSGKSNMPDVCRRLKSVEHRLMRQEIVASYQRITAKYLISVKDRLDKTEELEIADAPRAITKRRNLRNGLFDVDGAAEYLGCRPGLIRKLVKNDKLTVCRPGDKLLRFLQDDLDAYLSQDKEKQEQQGKPQKRKQSAVKPVKSKTVTLADIRRQWKRGRNGNNEQER